MLVFRVYTSFLQQNLSIILDNTCSRWANRCTFETAFVRSIFDVKMKSDW